jgi:hypothetical protein
LHSSLRRGYEYRHGWREKKHYVSRSVWKVSHCAHSLAWLYTALFASYWTCVKQPHCLHYLLAWIHSSDAHTYTHKYTHTNTHTCTMTQTYSSDTHVHVYWHKHTYIHTHTHRHSSPLWRRHSGWLRSVSRQGGSSLQVSIFQRQNIIVAHLQTLRVLTFSNKLWSTELLVRQSLPKLTLELLWKGFGCLIPRVFFLPIIPQLGPKGQGFTGQT